MDSTLGGKVAIVTGASSGIGAATARTLAAAGAAVMIAARREDRLDELVVDIVSQGGRAAACRTDVSVRALSWGLHLELGASHGIRVTDIQPGMVETELTDHIADESLREGFKSAWKDRRALKPEDIARSVLFAVASPEHMSVSEILVRPTDQPTRFRGSTRSAEGASGRSAGRPFFGDALVRSLVASSTGRRWVGPAPLRSRSR